MQADETKKNHPEMIFRCVNCGLERSYPSREPGVFDLQYCWEGECAPQRVIDQIGRLPVTPSVQRRPSIIQDRTRYARNRAK
jgi:hypothetical protein